MDADLGYQLWVEPPRYVVELEEEALVPEESPTITREDRTECKIIKVMKGGEKVQVCVPLGDQ